MKLPRPTQPLGPGRLAIRFDPHRSGNHHWSIVSDAPLYHRLVGYKRGPGENFAGQHVYRFRKYETARKALVRILDGQPIQDGKA